MSEYILNWQSQGAEGIPGKSNITLPQEAANSSSTSLVLTGKALENYGEIQQENFMRLLENFASANPPSNPTVGQLWFKANSNSLYVLSSSALLSAEPEYITTGSSTSWLRIPLDVNGRIRVGSGASNSVVRLNLNGGTDSNTGAYVAIQKAGTSIGFFGDTGVLEANASSDLGVWASTGKALRLYTNGLERVRIDSEGRVGIGTSSPSNQLHVVAAGEQVRIQGTGDSDAVISMQPSGGAVYNWIRLYGADGSSSASITSHSGSALYLTTGTNGTIHYRASGAGLHLWYCNETVAEGATERMRLDNSGNLGIGTAAPTEKLEVKGSISAWQADGNTFLKLGRQGDPIYYNGIQIFSGYNLTAPSLIFNNDYEGARIDFNRQSLKFTYADTSELLRISNTGALGIGGTNYGAAGQVLTSNGSSGPPSWSSAVSTQYVDSADYLNLPPLAGFLKNNSVPVYADFKFSLAAWSSVSHSFVDREGKIVTFFTSTSVTDARSTFRAYKFSDTDAYKFDGEPVSATFLTSSEKVQYIINAGTFFAVLYITTKSVPETLTRVVIVKTGGSSDWRDWTLSADVTSRHSSRTNYSLIETASGDRILESSISSDGASVTLTVLDSSLSVLRSQEIYNRATMVNNTDTTGAGRTAPLLGIIGYSNSAFLYPFGWNSFTETFYQRFHTWYVGQSSTGQSLGTGLCLDVVWSIPLSWIESGTGSPSNLIPVKSGTFRYSQLPDSTWDTETGGISTSWGDAGTITSVITDEYTGDMYLTSKGTWTSSDGGFLRRLRYESGIVYKTLTAYLQPKVTLEATATLPDASPWSKSISSTYGHVVGNNILFNGGSTSNGSKLVQAEFSTSSFLSVAQGISNDTLNLNATSALLDQHLTAPSAVSSDFNPGNIATTVVAGSPIYYHIKPGQKIYTISATGASRSYTETALTVPSIPSSMSGQTGITWYGITVWNGSSSAPIYWALVKNTTGQLFMAKCSSSTWSIPNTSLGLLQTEIDAGKTDRGDGLNTTYDFSGRGNCLLTENGRFLFGYGIPTTGGSSFGWCAYQTNNDTAQVGSLSQFSPISTGAGGYGPTNGYGGSSFGYSTTFGYYCMVSTSTYNAAALVCSKDIRGVIAELTEAQWFSGSTTRPQIWLSTQSATGLIAYVYDYPLFIGGYLTSTGNVSVNLYPSSVNYLYAVKASSDRTTVTYLASKKVLPTTFSRVLLAKITTDDENVISSELYPVIQHDALEELSNVSITSKVAGDALIWNGSAWTASATGGVPTYGYVGISGQHVASWIRFPDGFTIQYGRIQLINGLGGSGIVGFDYGRTILFARAFSGPATPGEADTHPHIVIGGIYSAGEPTDLRFLGQALIQDRSSTGFNISMRWNGDNFTSTISSPPTVIAGYIAYGFS